MLKEKPSSREYPFHKYISHAFRPAPGPEESAREPFADVGFPTAPARDSQKLGENPPAAIGVLLLVSCSRKAEKAGLPE